MEKNNSNEHYYKLSIAPMLDITTNHFRSFMRLLTKETLISKPISLAPRDGTTFANFNNTSKTLKFRYNLRNLDIPKNIEITGIQLKFYAETDMHSSRLALDPVRSKMFLNSIHTRDNGDKFSVEEEINVATDIITWGKGKKRYTIGNKNYLV